MKISRRKFLAAAPVVAGAVMQFNGSAFGQRPDKVRYVAIGGDGLARLSWDSFYQFINTDFAFGKGVDAVPLRLVDMADSRPLRTRRKSGMQENFEMKFQGPSDRVLPQGTYRVNHFDLGRFDLFITNGGQVGKEQFYIAVVNRVVE